MGERKAAITAGTWKSLFPVTWNWTSPGELRKLLGIAVFLESWNSCESAKEHRIRKYSSRVHCASAPSILLQDVIWNTD